MNVDFQEQDITIEFTPEGQDGQSLKPKGAWSDTEKYKTLDLVTYQGDSYIALKAVPVGTLPTDTEYWMINASNQTTYWGTIAGTLTDQVDLKNALDAKADADEVYTKTETDDLLSLKADADDVYTKTAVDDALDLKADKADVYTQQELDGIFDGIDNALDTKADKSDTYTKTQTDTLLSAKADASAVYSKGETDSLLNAKANAADVYAKSQTYSKTETDDLLSTKANTADLGTLAGMNSIDYTSNYLTNKPTLGSLADQDTVDYATEVTNKPTLGDLAALNSIDYTSNYLTNKPTLGSLADQDSVDYETEVTNKPTLGTMSAESASDYYDKTEVNDLINNSGVVAELDASGSIATFETNLAENLSRLNVSIGPVQDLHGYDSPWPAGGGSNIWDEEWEVGGYSTENGEKDQRTDRIRSKGYIPVSPNTSYYFVRPNDIAGNILEYGSDKTYIDVKSSPNAFTTSANTYYITFYFGPAYGATYHNDIAINYPATVTTYSPYSNICPISGHSSATVTRTGKNLGKLSVGNIGVTQNITNTFSDSGVTFTPTANYARTNFVFSTVVGQKYTISFKGYGDTNYRQVLIGTDSANWSNPDQTYGSFNITSGSTPTQYTYTLTAVSTTLVIGFYVSSSSSTGTLTIEDFQIELGSSASTYESPHVQTVTIALGDTRYKGMLDALAGTLTVTHKLVNFSDMYWYSSTAYEGNLNATNGLISIRTYNNSMETQGLKRGKIDFVLCNYFEYKKDLTWNTATDANSCAYLEDIYLRTTYNAIGLSEWTNTAATINSAFTSSEIYQNGYIVWELATPTTVSLTPAQMSLLLGENNVWADTGDVSLSYFNNSTAEAITDVKQMIANTETSMTATRNYTSGSLIIVGSALLKATSNISSGASLVIGTNCVRTTLEEWILSLIA